MALVETMRCWNCGSMCSAANDALARAHWQATIYIEVLGAKAITAESNSCPGCMAALRAAELASAECPYCVTSFSLPGAAH